MPATRRLRILVVDDDPAMVGAITALVGTEGHQVITAYDGLTAVKRFKEDAPDVVLLDLGLPDRPGLEVARAVRGNPDTRDTPIFALTGRVGADERRACLEAGCSAYVAKPVEPRALLRRIDETLGQGA